MNVTDPQIYLASSSPRRQQLLDQIKVRYLLLAPQINETPRPQEPPVDYALRIAIEKARTGRKLQQEATPSIPYLPVLGADTVVTSDNNIFGKPKNREDSLNMLEQLSGKSHDVISAIALITRNKEYTAVCTSSVTFRHTTPEEREQYWLSGEPEDKAGSYAIQGTGAVFISNISGSYSGVMGLPLFETAKILQESGIVVPN